MWLALTVLTVAACGAPGEAQEERRIQAMAQELMPHIERVTGLRFATPPTIKIRDASQVRQYLASKLDDEYPGDDFDRVTLAYRLFGLIPDTLDLRALLLALYTEQVLGYYDPDSAALYVVRGARGAALEGTLAHELVHALQGQHVRLDSLLSLERQNDRRLAAQAVMEGQAMLSTLLALNPSLDLDVLGNLRSDLADRVRRQQERMPVFSAAPRAIRESLVFPYLAGMDFVRWFATHYADTVPFGPRLPVSTEQILHPDRYQGRDAPVELTYADGAEPLYEDNLGEFETRLLLTELTGSESAGAAGALGWGGDRYGVFGTLDAAALVWWTVWDSERAADRFARLLEHRWPISARPARRHTLARVAVGGYPAVRLIDAPREWAGWARPPSVVVTGR